MVRRAAGSLSKSRIFLREQIARQFGFLQQEGGVCPDENLGVARLMIVRGVGIRDQERGQGKSRQLGQAGRAGARDREIGRAVNFLHLMMKRRDVGGNVFAPIIIRQQTLVAAAGKMNHLERDRPAAKASI